ncbi:acyltransferase family protein [Paraburkholderia caballeronis]|uniref:Peptidoglycan/LPS O-acetylase OafA/YrhL, contains acyltransferase and SGNH-hydrolase domains n=1 Tax=Paraburkholderia caballeronis TaxID=416943 RepID=A0A1H7U066_9BURK|nr:acyltransferase [Paraburkholderia caballeronis]PXW23419.1 peptidoglycan/LPS O-acetylase OafA/YrhL [Paraburkholderia caballeronis]PXW98412.1 peptidoglycan/LPS O-acetylase OafA/YrhL [Paraburkholderia caballeronis]RAJ95143.1 peptidoglycan/LPS O-acetylase OafA/YrhL [Paraburkholderia caballeronis]SEC54636.1 Peptidoglycan/LPS O-acetylase OafA/YrhL, contains acyltransferase and SGNH-hydrolase domains [Paraburkholderia caballeronis]SEL90078.1 Peptidoglycan/LPS O-acetylase OafA/YrhL, contains acyltr
MTIRSLEGLRGAAALLVVFYHLNLAFHYLLGVDYPALFVARNGYLAVDLFFVLSGFVINRAYRKTIDGSPELFRFMIRRFGRIWPLHIATTIILVIGTVTLGIDSIPAPSVSIALVTMTQGFNLFSHNVGTRASWSAADEFYTYLLFGVLCLFLSSRKRQSLFVLFAAVGYAIAIRSSVANECLTHGHCFDLTFRYGWARCIAGFFIGALCSDRLPPSAAQRFSTAIFQIPVFTISVGLIVATSLIPWLAFAAPLIFLALVVSLSEDAGPVARLFQLRAFQYLGKISYSLYLVHAMLTGFLVLFSPQLHSIRGPMLVGLIFIFMSILIADVLSRCIEMPFRSIFRKVADRASIKRPKSAAQNRRPSPAQEP